MPLVALICPHCGAALDGGSARSIHVCSACGASSELPAGGDRLVGVERILVRPRRPLPDGGEIVLLPVWCLPVHREALGPAGDRLPAEMRVPALGLGRMNLLLRHAAHLSRAPGTLELDPLERGASPAELALPDAWEIAELVALGLVEGWPTDEEIDHVEIPFGPGRLVELPCRREGSQLVDLVFGLSVHSALVEAFSLPDRRSQLTTGQEPVSEPRD